MRSNPFDEIEDVLNRIGMELEEGVVGGLGRGSVPVDVLDETDAFTVEAGLPGCSPDDIELSMTDGTLVLAAAISEPAEDARYLKRERPRGSVSRRIRFPEPVDEEDVSASYDDGVLSVHVPKATADGSTRIDIE